ncbi:MAG: DMT family transporter [Shimia sp.]
MRPDRPLLGIALMAGFCVLAPLGDAISKLLTASTAIAVIVLARFAAQALLLGPLALAAGRPFAVPPHLRAAFYARTALHVAGLATMFAALRHLPLADAIAIAFVMPFLLLLLGWRFLGEAVGPARLGACAVGFAGTLMVVQPAFAEVGAAALLPLGVAVIFALFILVTRQLARAVDPVALQALSGGLAMAVLAPALALAAGAGWVEVAVPSARDAALLAATGATGAVAHLAMTLSLRFAPATTLAPLQYLEIPVAAAFGLAIFGDFPDGLALAGIGVTLAAGLFVVWRERRSLAASPTPPRATPPMPAPAPPGAASPRAR